MFCVAYKKENTAFVYKDQPGYYGGMSEKLHTHMHSHNETSPTSPRREDAWKYFAVAAVNGLLTVGSSLFGSHSNIQGAFFAEGVHDSGDMALQASRGVVAFSNLQENRHYQWFRKATYGVTFTLASWVALRSGLDLASVLAKNSITLSTKSDVLGAGVVAAGNTAGYLIAHTIDPTGDNAKDMRRHAKVDFYSSAGNAMCIASGMFVPLSPQLGGIAFSLYTAWSFRPTDHNMTHHG